jgi:hypothetical protein
MILRKLAPYLVLAAAVGGCRLFDFDSCLYELRSVEVTGTIANSSEEVLFVSISVSEQRDYQPDNNMLWIIRVLPLVGHVK